MERSLIAATQPLTNQMWRWMHPMISENGAKYKKIIIKLASACFSRASRARNCFILQVCFLFLHWLHQFQKCALKRFLLQNWCYRRCLLLQCSKTQCTSSLNWLHQVQRQCRVNANWCKQYFVFYGCTTLHEAALSCNGLRQNRKRSNCKLHSEDSYKIRQL